MIDGWTHAWTYSKSVFTVPSNMANHSFNLFVSFSINGLKENVEKLNYYAFWEKT